MSLINDSNDQIHLWVAKVCQSQEWKFKNTDTIDKIIVTFFTKQQYIAAGSPISFQRNSMTLNLRRDSLKQRCHMGPM